MERNWRHDALVEIGGCGCFVDDAGVMEPAA